MIHRAEHVIEIDRAVEEVPGDVALSARRKTSAAMVWVPFGQLMWAKYSSVQN